MARHLRPHFPERYARSLSAGAALAGMLLAFGGGAARARDGAGLALQPVAEPSVTTLLLHQITTDPIRSAHGEDNVTHPWLTPEQFDDLLASLERDGYTVVTLEAALAILDARGADRRAGGPAKPLLLTFDDGYESAWTVATPILRKHHAPAVMFFEGKPTDVEPGRLTTAELLAMKASGIWTLESHGWAGHSEVTIDAAGTRVPYWYANLAWLPDRQRLETVAEYEARIRADLRRFRTTFERRLGARIDVFAYPSGEYGENPALPPGANPLTHLNAGHSNSAALTDAFFDALKAEGFRAAFAVSVPGGTHAAAPQDGPYAFPRLGVGAEFDPAALGALDAHDVELPEVASNDTYGDCASLATDDRGLWTASSSVPEIYRLDPDGRVVRDLTLPQLAADRAAEPALISAIGVRAPDELAIFQQAGWWRGGTPYLNDVAIDGRGATIVSRTPLPSVLNWTVGAVILDGRIVAMTDEGRFYDVADPGAPLFSVALSPDVPRGRRFAGPALIGDRIFVADRVLHRLDELDRSGAVIASAPLDGNVRALGARGDQLIVVDWQAQRRVLRRFVLVGA
jgi:peptidoglycan/xylan/chitin deacetylase (PgdA/CDA1 family)